MRELRRRLLEAFAAEGIELPEPGHMPWVQRDPGSSQESDIRAE
jgi:hypothetical protein